MIKVRQAAFPQDYRKLSPSAIRAALPSFLFYKAKDALPDADSPPRSFPIRRPRSSKLSPLGRWYSPPVVTDAAPLPAPPMLPSGAVGLGGGGHRQQRGEVLAERVAPTARSATHNILMTIAAFEGRSFRVGDIPSAYLQADHVPSNGKPVHIVADKYTTSLIVEAMPEYMPELVDINAQHKRPSF